MKSYTPSIIAYAGEIVCDAIFLNPVRNVNYWFMFMNKGYGNITFRLKQVLLPNIAMIKIDNKNKMPKRCNKN